MTGAGPEGSRTRARAGGGLLVTALVAFAAGALGAVIGATAMHMSHERAPESFHALLHDSLTLSPDQDRALHELEARFAVTRGDLEAELVAANRGLAAAIRANPAYAAEVGEAVEQVHHAMGELQQATIRHVYDMRAILTEEQAQVFDERIARALADAGD